MRVAIFDFDGTLYKKETFPLFMEVLKNHPTYGVRYKRFFRSILLPYFSYKLKLYPERKMKYDLMQQYVRALDGLTKDEINTFFQQIAEQMEGDFNETVVAALNEHAKDGLYVMIVSGAFTPLLHIMAKKFPVDQTIGTKLHYDAGRLNSSRHIDHVQEERKVELINEVLQREEVDWENSFAYGDSFADVPVLNLVGNPVAVAPDEQLKHHALKHEWNLIE